MRHKEEDDKGVVFHVIIILLDLVTFMFCFFCVAFCQCFEIEKLIKAKEKEQEIRFFLSEIGKTCGNAFEINRR